MNFKMDGKRIILAAHRGDKKRFPENTLPAFEAAIKQRVDMIETDVHMTRDGALIIIHDRSLERTAGYEGFTNEVSLKEVKALDAGAWFGEEFSGTKIPTLEEFIALIKDTEVLINWELKDYPFEVGDEFAFSAADKLISAIEAHGLAKRSMINSFSDRVLAYVYKKYGKAFPIHGQGIYHCQRTKDLADVRQEELYDWCCLYPNEKGRTPLEFPENFAYCREHDIIPCVCVPDDIDTYQKYVSLGCRMFTSNDILKADEILRDLNLRT
jgi:glycerophosphoryl diester phosphodiesterase